MPQKDQKIQVNKRKSKFLDKWAKGLCNISQACKEAEIDRKTYYRWIEDDSEFKDKVSDVKEAFDDKIEGVIKDMALKKNEKMLVLYAKSIMKKRGYVEKTETEHSGKIDNKVEIEVFMTQDRINDETKNNNSVPKD